jgi:hypothetical protein
MGRTADEELDHQRWVRARYEQYEEAIAWCKSGAGGAKKAYSTGQWDLITVSGLLRRLKPPEAGGVVNGEEYADRSILTMQEERQLAAWLKAENKVLKGKTRDEQRTKIVEILRHRKRQNKRGGRARVPVSNAATAVIDDAGINLPSNEWFVSFFARWEDVVTEKRQKRENLDRMKKHNETVVTNHFTGRSKSGLQHKRSESGSMVRRKREMQRKLWRLLRS